MSTIGQTVAEVYIIQPRYVCACACACVRARVCVWVCVGVHVCSNHWSGSTGGTLQ